jgi:hypothetical protein
MMKRPVIALEISKLMAAFEMCWLPETANLARTMSPSSPKTLPIKRAKYYTASTM